MNFKPITDMTTVEIFLRLGIAVIFPVVLAVTEMRRERKQQRQKSAVRDNEKER